MLPKAILELAENFQKFPGVGLKSSQKLALDVLAMKQEDYQIFLNSALQIKQEVKLCSQCGFFAQKSENSREKHVCEVCKNLTRNDYQICLVEKNTDVLTLEKAQIFNGRYQVLENLISPLENIFPENTKVGYFFNQRLPQLLTKLENLRKIKTPEKMELILFFKAGFAAQATTAYIKEFIIQKNLQNRVYLTKLAEGLPLYYNPDTLDQATMAKALEDRRGVI
jgi:recombination protein RecR